MTLKHITERLQALAKEMADAERWLDHDACVLAADELEDLRVGRTYVEQDEDAD